MKKIAWTFHRFGFTLCNWILSATASNAIKQKQKTVCVCLCCLNVLPHFRYNMLSWEMSSSALILRSCPDDFLSLSPFSGMRPHLSLVTIYTLFHHKVLQVTHTPGQTHTHRPPISCLIQTCLMSPLTDPHRVRSTHAHRHSITGKQLRPHINPSSKASFRPFPMRMRCPEALWCYLPSAKARMWSMPP